MRLSIGLGAEKEYEKRNTKYRNTIPVLSNIRKASQQKDSIGEIPDIIYSLKAKAKKLDDEESKKAKLDHKTFEVFTSTQANFKHPGQTELATLLQENAALISDLDISKKKGMNLEIRLKDLEQFKSEQESRINSLRKKEILIKKDLSSTNEKITKGSVELQGLFNILNGVSAKQAEETREEKVRYSNIPEGSNFLSSTHADEKSVVSLKKKILLAQIKKLEEDVQGVTIEYKKSEIKHDDTKADGFSKEEKVLLNEICKAKKYISMIESDNRSLISQIEKFCH